MPNGETWIGPNADMVMLRARQPNALAQSRLKLARREALAANMARTIAGADEDQFLALHVGSAVGRRRIIEHSFSAAAAGEDARFPQFIASVGERELKLAMRNEPPFRSARIAAKTRRAAPVNRPLDAHRGEGVQVADDPRKTQWPCKPCFRWLRWLDTDRAPRRGVVNSGQCFARSS